jgi:hypothetical protein
MYCKTYLKIRSTFRSLAMFLWKRLLDIVVTGQCEVAIDPMEAHGIRLTREMILSMVSKYSEGQ